MQKEMKWLCGVRRGERGEPLLAAAVERMDPGYAGNSDIKWNFTKFLVDRKGEVVKRYEPTADMLAIEAEVDRLIRQ